MPGRGPCLFSRIRHRGRGAAVDRGAAGGVGDLHAVAEELGDQLDIRCFAAAGASAGELEERLFELAALDGFLGHRVGLGSTGSGRYSQLSAWSMCSSIGFMTRAFSLAGQTSAQEPQPVQSIAETWMRYWKLS